MKKFFKASVAVLSILLCFGACSSSKPPEEPMTTAKQSVTYKNEIGQTVPVAENIGDYPGITQPKKFVETVHKVEYVYRSYNTFGKTYASIQGVEFENIESPQGYLYGFVSAKMISKGKDKQMKIGYIAYDADGKLLKGDGVMTRDIGAFDDGDVFELNLVVPLGTAKIEFIDYTVE